MSWLSSQELSAFIGVALVLGVLYGMTGGWVRGVLMLGTLAFVAVQFTRGGDYSSRILILASRLHFEWLLAAGQERESALWLGR